MPQSPDGSPFSNDMVAYAPYWVGRVCLGKGSGMERNYRRTPAKRQLRSMAMTEDDIERDRKLRDLRTAIDHITTRKWTDAEWEGWLQKQINYLRK